MYHHIQFCSPGDWNQDFAHARQALCQLSCASRRQVKISTRFWGHRHIWILQRLEDERSVLLILGWDFSAKISGRRQKGCDYGDVPQRTMTPVRSHSEHVKLKGWGVAQLPSKYLFFPLNLLLPNSSSDDEPSYGFSLFLTWYQIKGLEPAFRTCF